MQAAHTDRVLRVLTMCQGKANGISAVDLAQAASTTARHVRDAVTELRMRGIAVCGRPETGYFLAVTAEELEETCKFLRSRALSSLALEAQLCRVPLPQLVGQMALDLGEPQRAI